MELFFSSSNLIKTVSYFIGVPKGVLYQQNPLFINPDLPRGADHQWFTADDGFRLSLFSPARHSGNLDYATMINIFGEERAEEKVNMGAY